MRLRPALGLALAVVAPLTAPAGAGATVRLVATAGNDAQTQCAPTPCSSIMRAVDVADTGDTIRIGPGSFGAAITTAKRLDFEGAGATPLGAANDPVRETRVFSGLTLTGGGSVKRMQITGAGGLPAARGLKLVSNGAADDYLVEDAVLVCGPGAASDNAAALELAPDDAAVLLDLTVRRA